jgi:hypothetical protein
VATVVCPYTGAAMSWRVPKGVTSATFNLYGAQGGSQADTSRSVPGGLGAHLHSVQAVRPGQVLTIVVGGSPAPNSVTGGFNGGGSASGRTRPYSLAGGGGGGATDVRTGPGYTLADRMLVAGGGGGNGGNAYGGGAWATAWPSSPTGRPEPLWRAVRMVRDKIAGSDTCGEANRPPGFDHVLPPPAILWRSAGSERIIPPGC